MTMGVLKDDVKSTGDGFWETKYFKIEAILAF